jgi:hypothetical protein
MEDNTLQVTITGTRPILMHNARLSDPLDPIVRSMKTFNKAPGKKTDDDYAGLASLEYEGGLYLDSDLGPYIPSENIRRCLVEGGKRRKLGKDVERGVEVIVAGASLLDVSEVNPLLYTGPRDLEGLRADANFTFRKSVKVGMSRVMRTRPLFRDWSLDFDLLVDPEVLNRDTVLELLELAGMYVGLGDWRPTFGKFTVEERK